MLTERQLRAVEEFILQPPTLENLDLHTAVKCLLQIRNKAVEISDSHQFEHRFGIDAAERILLAGEEKCILL